MNGKIVGGGLVIMAAIAGAAVYYTQEHAYYYDLAQSDTVTMTTVGGELEALPVSDFQGVDAESSPLRYRACFTVSVSLATLTETFEIAADAEPRIGPRSLGCYDAVAVGTALESGDAVAFVGQREIHPGFDRMIAIMRNGQGYAWHQPAEDTE